MATTAHRTFRLAERMSRLGTESAFEVLVRARELEARGKEIIHLEIGEPDFATPPNIVEAAARALREGWTHYGPPAGLPQLRGSIAETTSEHLGIPVDAGEVVVTPGGKPIMFFTILALVNEGIVLSLIRHEAAVLVHHPAQVASNAPMVEGDGTHVPATLHQTQHLRVVSVPAEAFRTAGFARARELGFIAFDNLARATKRARIRRRRHRFAYPMAKEPRGFHAAIERPLNLAGADTFLAGRNELDGLQPKPQREMAVLEDRADPHREGLTAGVALAQAGARGLAVQPADLVARGLAMRADRAVRPKLLFDVLKSRFFVVEPQIGKDRFRHGLSPLAKPVAA